MKDDMTMETTLGSGQQKYNAFCQMKLLFTGPVPPLIYQHIEIRCIFLAKEKKNKGTNIVFSFV